MSGDKRGPRRSVKIHWSDRAKDDLAAIGDYIAADNPVAAIRWFERLIADVERAAGRRARRRDASRRTRRARPRRPRRHPRGVQAQVPQAGAPIRGKGR